MSNIIIPPEHQSAPKTAPLITNLSSPQTKKQWDGKYYKGDDLEVDDAMEVYASADPRVAAELRNFSERHMSKSPEQTIEGLLELHEKNYASHYEQRWSGQKRWMGRENEEMRLVNILHCDTFIERLRKAGIDASHEDPFEWYRDNKIPAECWPRPAARLWLNSFIAMIPMEQPDGSIRKVSSQRVGISAWKEGRPQTVTTLQHPWSPEYSLMRFDSYDVPTTERYRGWRTALITLVQTEVLTEAEVERAFGPALGPAGEFYREQMYRLRAISIGLTKDDE